MSPKEIEPIVVRRLRAVFPGQEVVGQWNPFPGVRNMYTPKPDVAVGPFAIYDNFEDEYTRIIDNNLALVRSFLNFHNENIDGSRLPHASLQGVVNSNLNARCLLCIEFENKTGTKHILGALVNASALGRIGVLVAWSPIQLRLMIKQRVYQEYLRRVRKNHFYTDNILILSKEQFIRALNLRTNNRRVN